MKTLLSFLLALALSGPLHAGDYEKRTAPMPEGGTLGYRLLLPGPHEGKVPLVLMLHGAGERGDDNAAQLKYGAPLFQKAQDKFPCYVLVPQCPSGQKWADVDWSKPAIEQPPDLSPSMKAVVGVLDALPKEFPDLDLDRIYVTGLSMGGYGTWDLLARFPHRFAAAAPICGGGDVKTARALVQTPVWAFHGAKDPTVRVALTRNLVAAMEKAGGHPLYSEYPTAKHDSWNIAYAEPELLPWMFAQRRGQPAVGFEKVAAHLAQPPSNLFPASGPVQDGIWFRPLWQSRRTEWENAAAADQGSIVFLGDSITQGWGSLAHDFARRKVANRGISGDTTRGVLYRLKGDVIDLHPMAVSLLIGTNDIGLGGEAETAAANVRRIIAELRAANPKLPIVLNTVMPSTPKKDRPADKLKHLNALLAEVVDSAPNIATVDTWSLFANEEGEAKIEEFPDLLHPNAAGYAKWQAALEGAFEKLNLHLPSR